MLRRCPAIHNKLGATSSFGASWECQKKNSFPRLDGRSSQSSEASSNACILGFRHLEVMTGSLRTGCESASGSTIEAREKNRMLYAITILPAMQTAFGSELFGNLASLLWCKQPTMEECSPEKNWNLARKPTTMSVSQLAAQHVCAEVAP